MKNRYCIICFILFSVLCFHLKANDGAYLGSGNQLIPILDSDITVQKEILSITRNAKNDRMVDVSVYYEFRNPGKAKILTVGFEAVSPYGDARVTPDKGKHPYITDFSINVNDQKLPYEVAIVRDSTYLEKGVFNMLTNKEISENIEDGGGESANFFYVYHFRANFAHGVNIVKHTYTYELSSNVDNIYMFNYVLTAAMRWGNKQIDDFTLNIDMGDYQEIYVPETFFESDSDWSIDGVGHSVVLSNRTSYFDGTEKALVFYIQKGKLVFQKKNFKPKGELSFYSPLGLFFENTFDYLKEKSFPYNYHFYYEDLKPTDEISLKILRNLPFAYRGYVFSTSKLQNYYKQQIWYNADPSYKAEIDSLPKKEQEWINYWSSYSME